MTARVLGDLVGPIYLDFLFYPASLVQPNKRDKQNKPERPESVSEGDVII